MISALFVEKEGCYSSLDKIDLWDISRDAKNYNGPYPVIAHPPCQRWGKMAIVNYKRWGGEHNKLGNDNGCFESALDSVNKYCGVLEHPANSYAFNTYGLEKPELGKWKKSGLGWVTEIYQAAYGHRAQKKTWLYYVGREPFPLNWKRVNGTHQIGFYDQRGKQKNKPTLSKKEANATPILFRDELIKLANHSIP